MRKDEKGGLREAGGRTVIKSAGSKIMRHAAACELASGCVAAPSCFDGERLRLPCSWSRILKPNSCRLNRSQCHEEIATEGHWGCAKHTLKDEDILVTGAYLKRWRENCSSDAEISESLFASFTRLNQPQHHTF